jgi:exodeoxyribonuclease V alpha subunit
MSLLRELADRSVLAPLDLELAHCLARLGGERDERVLVAAALASRAVGLGHLCADLPRVTTTALCNCDEELVVVRWPELDPWLTALRNSRLVARMQLGPTLEAERPLVLDDSGRIYLRRYADYQLRLAREIAELSSRRDSGDSWDALLSRFFGDDDSNTQKLAARAAVTCGFCIVSGGPGTGKTTTVVRILALMQERALMMGTAPLRIKLLAPTGKAAQRLRESIRAELDALPCQPSVRLALARHADEASTIHRALGYRPHTPTRFRYGRERRLAHDAVFVDEASMVDAALMCKLVEAVPRKSSLVLLGDKDQLASVEAGAILGDIYQAGLAGAAVHLDKSFRYREGSGIGRCTRAVNRGDADAAVAALGDDVTLEPFCELEPLTRAFGALVSERLRAFFSASGPEERLALLSRFRVLCAHRHGPCGVVAINAAIERHIMSLFGIRTDQAMYDGRPIIILRNDYQLGLYNGDIGVIAVVDGIRRAYFPGDGSGVPRVLSAARLPLHETVFAMTVHKSQGSEVDTVALVLPGRASPIVTRELIYTAISRARRQARLFGSEAILRQAIARRVERASGLTQLLASGDLTRPSAQPREIFGVADEVVE